MSRRPGFFSRRNVSSQLRSYPRSLPPLAAFLDAKTPPLHFVALSSQLRSYPRSLPPLAALLDAKSAPTVLAPGRTPGAALSSQLLFVALSSQLRSYPRSLPPLAVLLDAKTAPIGLAVAILVRN